MTPPLLTAHDAIGHVHLIVGSNPLANARCTRSLEVGAKPVVLVSESSWTHYGLQKKIDEGLVRCLKKDFAEHDLRGLGREEVDQIVDAVFVTLSKEHPTSKSLLPDLMYGMLIELGSLISKLCRRMRIPVNVVDAPNLSTFSLLSTHSDGPLQIGITTSGKGCKLAARIRREVAAGLPPDLGTAIDRLGAMRRKIWEQDHRAHDLADADESDDDAPNQKATFNQLVTEETESAAKARRIRWLGQICEYWPLRRLAAITNVEVDSLLASYSASQAMPSSTQISTPNAPGPTSKPSVILAGSGPGSPHLLTLATHRAIQTADFILADKLVPEPVLALIPRRTPVHIARKFPGNADAAQEELLELGLAALKRGKTVLRLKQGDPYIYGRGGEEYHFFQKHGYQSVVLPGITSALSAPLFAAIPCTHRGVADQVLICTGTGRKGAAPRPPPYVKSQTVIFLMALHRLGSLVDSLLGKVATSPEAKEALDMNDAPWPIETPCAVLERASCHDQRVIRTTLQHVVEAVEEEGSRPPGLLVVGWSCEILKGTEGSKWMVEEGFKGFGDLVNSLSALPNVPAADT